MSRPVPIAPSPGQESVWDYPRPPALEQSRESIEVTLGGVTIARTNRSWRVLETSHPPAYYLPRVAFLPGALVETQGATWCEWKGQASYFDVVGGGTTADKAAWTYLRPTGGYGRIAGAIALMAGQMDQVTVDDEEVEAQPGGFYGGWITTRVVGPFKGIAGSTGW